MQADSAPATPVAAAPRATAGASSAAPSSAATAKPFDDNTARVLRIEWQQKIQAAREADEISLEASKQLNQEVCIASAQITSEAAAKQFATDMQAKLDAEKTAQANRIAAEKKAAEEQRIAAEKEAAEMRAAQKKAEEDKRIAREESRKDEARKKKAAEDEWQQTLSRQEAEQAVLDKIQNLKFKLQKAQNHPSRRHVPRDGGLLVSVVFLIGGMDSGTVLTNRLSAHRARLSRPATG